MENKQPDTAVHDFLKEYRGLCVRHGQHITMFMSECLAVVPLPVDQVVLTHTRYGHEAVNFRSLSRVLDTGERGVDVYMPSPDALEQALQVQEKAFRQRLKDHLHKIDENRRLGRGKEEE